MGICCLREERVPDSSLDADEKGKNIEAKRKKQEKSPRRPRNRKKTSPRTATVGPPLARMPTVKSAHQRASSLTLSKSGRNLDDLQDEEGVALFQIPTKKLKKRFIDKFTVLTLINKSALGEFLLVEQVSTKAVSIVRKILRIGGNSYLEKSQEKKLRSEITLLSKIDHPNLLKYSEVLFDDRYIYAVSEVVISNKILSVEEIVKMKSEKAWANTAKQLLQAMSYCHSRGILHGNINVSNVFLLEIPKERVLVKVAGFGSYDFETFREAIDYPGFFVSPEGLEGEFTEKSDVWSCGVLLYLFICSNIPYSAPIFDDFQASLGNYPPSFMQRQWETVDPSLKLMLKEMLKRDISSRYSISQCLSHPWVQQHCSSSNVSEFALNAALTNMKLFVRGQKLKLIILSYVAMHVTPTEQKQELVEVFKFIDSDNDGVLNKDDLVRVYSRITRSDHAVLLANRVLECVDIDSNGSIDFSEFMLAASDHRALLTNKNLELIYEIFDQDKNGEVSVEELKATIKCEENDSEWRSLMKEADRNGDGVLSFKEFSKLIKKAVGDIRSIH